MHVRTISKLLTASMAMAAVFSPHVALAQTLTSTVWDIGSPINTNTNAALSETIGGITTVYAQSDYGKNHASAQLAYDPAHPFHFPNASSQYSDQFTALAANGLQTIVTPTTVQFEFTVTGSITNQTLGLTDIASLSVSSTNVSAANSAGSSTIGTTAYTYSPYHDAWTFHDTQNTVTYTSQPYTLVNGDDWITVTLQTYIFSIGLLPPTAADNVNFSDTVKLSGIQVYDSSNSLISNSNLNVSSLSGAAYPFTGGSSTPEPGSTAMLVGLGISACSFVRRRRNR